MLRACSLLLGRWNSRDFLKSRSKFSGAVHTRSVFGCRGRYKRWSSKYTLRDGYPHVNNHMKRGLGIKLGGGLFGLRIPRQNLLSTMTREEYELEMYGHPNITNPYRNCLHTHPTLPAVMANASLSLHLVILLPRIARGTQQINKQYNSKTFDERGNINNSNASEEINDKEVNANGDDRLHPSWNAVMKEAIASVNSLLAHNSTSNNNHKSSMMIEICFATLERSVRINVEHTISEADLYNSLCSLEQEHYKGRILHTGNTRRIVPIHMKTIMSQALIKERQRAIPLFGRQLRLLQESPSVNIKKQTCTTNTTNTNNDLKNICGANRINKFTSSSSAMSNDVSSTGVECVLRALRSSFTNALCACVLMNNNYNINALNYANMNANGKAHPAEETTTRMQEHRQLDRESHHLRKKSLFFAFPSSLHHPKSISSKDEEINVTNETSKSKDNEKKTDNELTTKEKLTESILYNCENVNDTTEKCSSAKTSQRCLLKDEVDSDALRGVWALPKNTLHKLLNWHYCNTDPRAHSADAIPHNKRALHLLLFIDASKCQSANDISKSNNNDAKEIITKPHITKSLVPHYFAEELERMGFRPLESTTLCGAAFELEKWLLSQKK